MRLDDFAPAPPRVRPLFLVDDEEIDRLVFARLVREADLGRPVRTFPSGEQFIDALIEVLRGAPPPLLCFIDVRMAGMHGFDVLRWIRCQRNLDKIPAVMLSSSEEMRDLKEARYSGAQCYVAKFPAPAQLRELVGEAERVAAAQSGQAFKLPFNLLADAPQPIR